MSKIVITGASGFIGTNLLQYFEDQGHEVINIDNETPRNLLQIENWRNVDIRDEAKFVQTVKDFKPELMFHLAARTDIDGKTLADYDSNTEGTKNAVLAAQAAGSVRRAIFFSSQLVVRVGYTPKDDLDVNPPNAYGESKAHGEKTVREMASNSMEWVIVRPTTIWGPWFGVKYQGLYRNIRRQRYVHPAGRKIKKVWGYVGNSVFHLDRLAYVDASKVHGKTIYMADYDPTDLLEYAQIIGECWGGKKVRQVPIAVLKALALTGDAMKLVGKNFPMTSYRLGNMLGQMDLSIEPLREICGPQPYTLRESAQATVDWMKAHEDFDRN